MVKYDTVLIRYGELSTKGKNRRDFITRLFTNIKYMLRDYPALTYRKTYDLSLIHISTFKYLSANFKHADGTDIMDAYAIKEIDGHKIGFVGICTPESYTKSTPVYFQDASGNYVYTFSCLLYTSRCV